MIELTELEKAFSIGGLILLSYFIKIPKLEINIWGWLGRKIGDALNANQKKEMDDIRESIKKLSDAFDAYKLEDKTREMNLKRQRILQFSDEMRRNVRHSKESFNDVLEDVDEYVKYCDSHPGYKNSRASMAIDYIEEQYKVIFRENDFLE